MSKGGEAPIEATSPIRMLTRTHPHSSAATPSVFLDDPVGGVQELAEVEGGGMMETLQRIFESGELVAPEMVYHARDPGIEVGSLKSSSGCARSERDLED